MTQGMSNPHNSKEKRMRNMWKKMRKERQRKRLSNLSKWR